MSKKRYIRVGFNFDDLRGMQLNEIGNVFTHEFDESFFLVDVRDDISSGHTFFLLESDKLKEVEEGSSIPVLFVKEDKEETEDGPEFFYNVPDYSEYIDSVEPEKMTHWTEEYKPVVLSSIASSRWEAYEEIMKEEMSKSILNTMIFGSHSFKIETEGNFGPISLPTGMEVKIDPLLKDDEAYLVKSFTPTWARAGDKLEMKIYNPWTGIMEEYDEPNEKPVSGCNHQWKPYMGFSEKYDYCDVPNCKARRDYTGS